jgi:hypothetical protein
VDPLGALADEIGCRVGRVAVAGLGAGLALREAHGLAAGDVNSREQDEFGGGGEFAHDSLGAAARRLGCLRTG